MTQTDGKIFDDVARLLTDAAQAAQGVGDELRGVLKGQVERLVNELDLVSREMFDAVAEMAAKAREDNARLEKRLRALEERMEATKPAAGKKRPKTK